MLDVLFGLIVVPVAFQLLLEGTILMLSILMLGFIIFIILVDILRRTFP